MKTHDPYDIWSLPTLGNIKSRWTNGEKKSALIVPIIGILEIFSPSILRKCLRVGPHEFAHVEALRYLSGAVGAHDALVFFKKYRVKNTAWGLPFAWFSKNGTYPADIPYITNTPYVMEALLNILASSEEKVEAQQLFDNTWMFLNSLEVMHSSDKELALSYAPVNELRMVVNANTYSALAYALHAVYGVEHRKKVSRERAGRLVNWVLAQQQPDGSWFYYADNDSGNFIDCFHSCFVIKNLIKVQRLLPDLSQLIQPAIDRGWEYITEHFYDSKYGLCRRFSHRSHRDPFRWDLYDQAEYLGLLVDFELYEQAEAFAKRVERKFSRNGHWYCRIDILGRRWGKDFLRWGIAPYHYHKHRLQLATGTL